MDKPSAQFIIFLKDPSEWQIKICKTEERKQMACTPLLPVKAELAHTDAADFQVELSLPSTRSRSRVPRRGNKTLSLDIQTYFTKSNAWKLYINSQGC